MPPLGNPSAISYSRSSARSDLKAFTSPLAAYNFRMRAICDVSDIRTFLLVAFKSPGLSNAIGLPTERVAQWLRKSLRLRQVASVPTVEIRMPGVWIAYRLPAGWHFEELNRWMDEMDLMDEMDSLDKSHSLSNPLPLSPLKIMSLRCRSVGPRNDPVGSR